MTPVAETPTLAVCSRAAFGGMLREADADLGLGDENLSDGSLIDAMMEHPILINRPLVVSPLEVRLCRPSEAVLDILPARQLGAFTKEDGEQVVDANGNRVQA